MKPLPRLALLLTLCGFCGMTSASDQLFPEPSALEPAVHFWTRVYTEISTDAGFIHDQYDLAIVYETLHFDPGMSPGARQREVDAEKRRFHDLLTRLAASSATDDPQAQRVRALWGKAGTAARFAAAADDVRFQLGQADRFRAGLVRAGVWKRHIAEVLTRAGLPPELAALPDVESSFDPAAYSKVGAAGLWQFLRSTGRRFLRINSAVDERLDPFRETEAAAQLLAYNYRLLGTWPLAITAYNHGAAGMMRAREQLGTDDIARIVRDYHSPSFGFASRNFYVSFLAALTVSQDPEKYFGPMHTQDEVPFREVRMQRAVSFTALAAAVGLDRHTLQELNPALRPAVFHDRRSIPIGYVLRLPEDRSQWTSQALADRLGSPRVVAVTAVGGSPQRGRGAAAPSAAAMPFAATATNVLIWPATSASAPAAPAELTALLPQASPTSDYYYLVQPQDTASSIADQAGLPVAELLALNSLPDQDFLYAGERLRLAPTVPQPGVAGNPLLAALAQQAIQETHEEQQAVALESHLAASTEPVSAAQAMAAGPQLVPGAGGPQWVDPVDYSVAADGSIHVVAAETLGHYAEWLDISATRLRALNHLRGRRPVVMGERLRLEFASATPRQFEQRRRDYHERLQAAYFAMHRIVGASVYVARRGDSLWNITQHDMRVPVWLLQQYNPNLDFRALRPGTQVSLPQIEEVSGT